MKIGKRNSLMAKGQKTQQTIECKAFRLSNDPALSRSVVQTNLQSVGVAADGGASCNKWPFCDG